MSKPRSYFEISLEANLLQRLRKQKGFSIRKLAEYMNFSYSRVHQFETGKAHISELYIKKFLSVTGISWNEWNYELSLCDESYELRLECLEKLKKLESSKLDIISKLLNNI